MHRSLHEFRNLDVKAKEFHPSTDIRSSALQRSAREAPLFTRILFCVAEGVMTGLIRQDYD